MKEELKDLPVEIQEHIFNWFCSGVNQRRFEWVIAGQSLSKTAYECNDGFLRQSICGRHCWRSEVHETLVGLVKVFAHSFRYSEQREPESHIVFAYRAGETGYSEVVYNGEPEERLIPCPAPWKGPTHLELIESNNVYGFGRGES